MVHDSDEPDVLETLADDIDGDGTSSLDDEDLSRWAQRRAFSDSELHRTHAVSHALLVVLLPASLLSHFPTSPDRAKLLNTLSTFVHCYSFSSGCATITAL